VRALVKLRKLSADSFSELLAALSRVPLSSSRDKLTEKVTNLIPSMTPKEVEDIVAMLVSVKGAQEQLEESADFVEDVLFAAARTEESDLKLAGSEREEFKRRLTDLLEVERFSISAKAISLVNEYEHTFCRARILTDLRPIYRDPSKGAVAGLITHTLRLSYHEGDQLRHIYLLIEDSDLEKMDLLVKRALIKAKSLQNQLAATQISLIGTSEKG